MDTISLYKLTKEQYYKRRDWLATVQSGSTAIVNGWERKPIVAQIERATKTQLVVKFPESERRVRFWRKTGEQIRGVMQIHPPA